MENIKERYNTDKLVRVVVNDFYASRWYSYKPEKRFLGFITREEGIYGFMSDNVRSIEQLSNHTLKDGIVFKNPEVVLSYQSDISKTYYFNTYEDAQRFASSVTRENKWIK